MLQQPGNTGDNIFRAGENRTTLQKTSSSPHTLGVKFSRDYMCPVKRQAEAAKLLETLQSPLESQKGNHSISELSCANKAAARCSASAGPTWGIKNQAPNKANGADQFKRPQKSYCQVLSRQCIARMIAAWVNV